MGEKSREIIHRVGKAQIPVVRDGVLILAVHDYNFCSSDNIAVYMDLVGDYTWGEKNSVGQQIGTGGKEKTHFTVQL